MSTPVLYTTGLVAAAALHQACRGGPGWCVGVTSDPCRRLAAVHLVDLTQEGYSWVECHSEQVARETEHLLHLGFGYETCRAVPTMADNMVFVYAYRISEDTTQGD